MANGAAIAVFDEILEPVTRAFTPEVARALLSLRASADAQTRIAALADKCDEGTLTAAERAEYETYVHALDLISVLQAKARLWLTRQCGTPLPILVEGNRRHGPVGCGWSSYWGRWPFPRTSAAGRAQFERRMEQRRRGDLGQAGGDGDHWAPDQMLASNRS
jgi:hypothetical protein